MKAQLTVYYEITLERAWFKDTESRDDCLAKLNSDAESMIQLQRGVYYNNSVIIKANKVHEVFMRVPATDAELAEAKARMKEDKK